MFSRRAGFRFNRGRIAVGTPGAGGGGPPPDTTPPELDGAPEVLAADAGYTIRCYCTEALDGTSTPAAARFALTNTPIDVVSVTLGADYFDLGLSAAISADETTIGVTYTPGANPIRDVAENDMLGFTDETVDNNAPHTLFRPYGYGTNLLLDLIANDDFFDLGAGGIAQWHDQSTFNNHATQPDIARQPSPAETVDSKRCVRFDKSNTEWMLIDGIAAALSGANVPFVFEWYGQPVVAASNGTLFSAGNTTLSPAMHLHYPSSSAQAWRAQRTQDSGSGGMNRTATPNVATSQRFFRLSFDGTNLTATVATTPGSTSAMTWSNAAWNAGTLTLDIASLGCNRNVAAPTGNLFGDYRVIRASLWAGGTLPGTTELDAWEVGVEA